MLVNQEEHLQALRQDFAMSMDCSSFFLDVGATIAVYLADALLAAMTHELWATKCSCKQSACMLTC